jgi:hypothetical protein
LVSGAVGNAFRQRDLEVRDAISIPTAATKILERKQGFAKQPVAGVSRAGFCKSSIRE